MHRLKGEVFAGGVTVITAVSLHVYPCTLSVGHRFLSNDVKLALMQAEALQGQRLPAELR